MKIKPLGNRVLIKPKEAENKTKSGIYIPDSAKEKTVQGEVVAVGDGKEVTVKAGDIVVYESYGGQEVEIDGKKHLIMEMKDVLAIVK
ncbi:co-chaperone GroES [Candidatus Woesearchaeota archaeon]|nr:co-chaperone GroES [Candidatus Woesearchaeota archaeon]